MGCGGRAIASGHVFKMHVMFTTSADLTTEVELPAPMLASFADAINRIVFPGEWMPEENIILLRGPIETTPQARELNEKCNVVLAGLRKKANHTSTGFAGRVVENEGPLLEANRMEEGPKYGKTIADDGWTAP